MAVAATSRLMVGVLCIRDHSCLGIGVGWLVKPATMRGVRSIENKLLKIMHHCVALLAGGLEVRVRIRPDVWSIVHVAR